MVGFKNDHLSSFTFPPKEQLLFNMSDVLGGHCDKEIGFTLRVGGKGSSIEDRRNWDCYLVDSSLKRIGVSDAKKMQGLPSDFKFSVSKTQAMKQLGNSVAINVVESVAKQVRKYMMILNIIK